MQIKWKQVAEDELNDIVDFIGNDSPTSAEQFAADLRAKVGTLCEHPELYRSGRKRGTREMVVHPNYIVIYRVINKASVVEILRVKHAAKKWPVTGARREQSMTKSLLDKLNAARKAAPKKKTVETVKKPAPQMSLHLMIIANHFLGHVYQRQLAPTPA